MIQELLPCPVCGSVVEIAETEDHALLVICSDNFCPGNFGSSQPTRAEAIAAWNVQARLWNIQSCPNCGWSEADEQAFFESQHNVFKVPRWKRIFRCIYRWIPFSSLYVFAVVLFLLRFFNEVAQSEGIESGITALTQFQLSFAFATPFLTYWVIDMLQTYIRDRELNQYFDNNQTTTTQQSQGEQS